MPSLQASLTYQPLELAFGTSGRRGLIRDMTALEVWINVTAELEYLQALGPAQGGIERGDEFFLARDLRPSSSGICRIVQEAVRTAGMRPVNVGAIPTPALTAFALERRRGSIMITGSHIPFDRNGYKLNTATGELLKEQEGPINAVVERVRERIYGQEMCDSPFQADGSLRHPPAELEAESTAARAGWVDRYTSFFSQAPLAGKRVLVYQHSAVGRDLLVEILRGLGAEVSPVGRSDSFVPIDTENIGAGELEEVRRLAAEAGPAFAVVSTDGDSDRPLILGPDSRSGTLQFFNGDLVGMVVAQYLKADAVVVPITCNDAIDRGALASVLEPKTRIGSPWVIAGMREAMAKGKKVVCGWEANGGFLLGSAIEGKAGRLSALETRDAFLPVIAVLCAAAERGVAVADLFSELPPRFGKAGLLRAFPRSTGLAIVRELNPATSTRFGNLSEIYNTLNSIFERSEGFSEIRSVDYTDGVRFYFGDGDVVHIRPSGNADELRIYALSGTPERAAALVEMGTREPAGLLRSLENLLA